MVTKYSFGGGLLDNNLYANNQRRKEEMNTMQGLLNDPAYQRAKANNKNTMSAINNPTPDNVMQRANALTPQMDIQYPAEVLAEPKKRNMLEEYLFGTQGFQPSVEQKKSVYRATKNLTDMEKLFFENNPDKFFEYFNKVGDYKVEPDTTSISSSFTNTGQETAEYFGLGSPDSKVAQQMGGDSAKFDPEADYKGTTKESRMTPDGRVRSYAQMIFDVNQNRDANFTNIQAEQKELGSQGNKTVQFATYNDDGSVTWSNPEPFFYNKVQEKIDGDFGTKVYNKWAIQGGFSSEVANIQNFNEVEQLLNDPRVETSGLLYEITPDKVSRLIESGYKAEKDDDGKTYQVNNALDLVRAVVFQSLKKTLGGQFTEREAERLVEATYNPSLPPAVNLKRIVALKNKMLETFRSQQRAVEYYEKNNGTLYGYDTTVSGIDLANLSKESITDFVDRTVMQSFSEDDYANMSDEEAGNYYTNKASVLEQQFMRTIFNIKD